MAPRSTIERTELAQKLGTMADWKQKVPWWMAGTGKSGLTPFDTHTANETTLTNQEWAQRKAIERFQKNKFFGFTTRELRALKAFAPLPLPEERRYKQCNLENAIHPLYERENWMKAAQYPKHLSPIPLGHGRDGFFEASNYLVWERLEPVLRLASQCISDDYEWSWWDALLTCDFRPIDDPSLQPTEKGKFFATFHQREGPITAADRKAMRRHFSNLAGKIIIGISDGDADPHTGVPYRPATRGYWDGVTISGGDSTLKWSFGKPIQLLLATYLIERLLRDDLTIGEQILNQFHVAQVLVHETAHAVFSLLQSNNANARRVEREPFFEDEALAELGLSVENVIFTGDHRPNYHASQYEGAPVSTLFRRPWPTTRHKDLLGEKCFRTTGAASLLTKKDISWPCSIAYVERLMQMEFWQYQVAVYGPLEVLHTGPRLSGRLFDEVLGKYIPFDEVLGKYIPFDDLKQALNVVSGLSSPAIVKEMERRGKALKVYDALRITIEREEVLDLEMENDSNQSTANMSEVDPTESPTTEMASGDRDLEIWNLIMDNQRALAMDTLDFRISEYGFLMYVNRVNDRDLITPEDFRHFIKHYRENGGRKLHLKWGLSENANIGWVERRNAGWEASVGEDIRLQAKFSNIESANLWLQFCNRLYFIELAFIPDDSPGFRDFGRTVVLTGINTRPGPQFTEAEFDEMIEHCLANGIFFTRGPPEVLRFRRDAFSRPMIENALVGVPESLQPDIIREIFEDRIRQFEPDLAQSSGVVACIIEALLSGPLENVVFLHENDEQLRGFLADAESQRHFIRRALLPRLSKHLPIDLIGQQRKNAAHAMVDALLDMKSQAVIVKLIEDDNTLKNVIDTEIIGSQPQI